MDPLTILAAFAPSVVKAGEAIIGRWLAPDTFKPTNVAEYVQMRQLDATIFKAINDAGGSEPTWPGVNAVKQLMRPAVAASAIGTWVVVHSGAVSITPEALQSVNNFAACIGFYLFGDRTLFHVGKAK